jgi:hypothetical protein
MHRVGLMMLMFAITACGGDGKGGDDQTPAMGADAIEDWLASGMFKSWAAEAAHGFNRIWSNDLIASNAGGSGDWPEGSAAVKELYASMTDATPIGVAVYLKLKSDSAGGSNWYWYERVPLDSTAPHDAKGVVADGTGASGPALQICVGCHGAAGADAAHTPTVGGRDQVYTPVR